MLLNLKLPFTVSYDKIRLDSKFFILLLLGTKMNNEVIKKQFCLPVTRPKFSQSIINIVLQALLVTTLEVMIMPPSIYTWLPNWKIKRSWSRRWKNYWLLNKVHCSWHSKEIQIAISPSPVVLSFSYEMFHIYFCYVV